MSSNTDRLRVVVATPLSEELCHHIEQLEPRIELVRDQSLYPPMRHPADFGGDPGLLADDRAATGLRGHARLGGGPLRHSRCRPGRSEAHRRRQPRPALGAHHGGRRWCPGQGGRTRRRTSCSGSPSRTSAGVHGGPLAEFAVFGVLAGAKDLPRLQGQQRDHELERALATAPGLGDDRAGRRAGRDRRRGGPPASGPRRHGDRHQPAPAPGGSRRPADHDRPDRRDRRRSGRHRAHPARYRRHREAHRRRGAGRGATRHHPGQRRPRHGGRRGRAAARAARRADRLRRAGRVRGRAAAARTVRCGTSRTSWSARIPRPSTPPRTDSSPSCSPTTRRGCWTARSSGIVVDTVDFY